jgi:putative oxidoreductase
MTPIVTTTATTTTASASSTLPQLYQRLIALFERIPHSFTALLARFSIAAVFWNSGQTKVEGLMINLVNGDFQLGWPHLNDTARVLFQDEYKLPFIPPEIAAPMAATAEHLFPLFLLLGLATRLSALGLLGMTLVIQVFVYPGAYPTHGTWAALLLLLISRGPGKVSLDHWIGRQWGR